MDSTPTPTSPSMNARILIGFLALVVLGLLAWELRWVLLVLFGSIVLAVALDVPVTLLRRILPVNRQTALAIELVVLVTFGGLLITLYFLCFFIGFRNNDITLLFSISTNFF